MRARMVVTVLAFLVIPTTQGEAQQRAAIDGFFDRFVEQSYAQRQPGEAQAQLKPALQTLLRSLPRRRPPAPSQALD